MIIPVFLIFRRKNPAFFSIEAVFDRIWSSPCALPVSIKHLVLPEFGVSVFNLKWLREKTRAQDSVFHITGDVHYAVFVLPRNRTVLTIHDCVFLTQNKGWKKWLLKKILLDLPVARCQYITTISEKTKNEIVSYTGCKSEKITVIGNPALPMLYYKKKSFNVLKPVLLFIGVTPNKNLARLVDALEGISCILVIVGKISVDQEKHLKAKNIDHQIFSNLTDTEIADRYAECDLVLFPSLYEGFGLPIIEGFKAGRAVLTSNKSPMKEVAEGAACLIDPESVTSIREGVLRLVNDVEYRESLITKGFEVVKQYAPEVIAEEYFKLYEKIYKGTCAE